MNSSPNQNIWISRKCRISRISGIFRMSRISRIYRTSRLSRTFRTSRISGIFPLGVNSWSWAPETWRRPSNDQSANQTAAKRPVCHLVAGIWQRTTRYEPAKKNSSLKKLWTWLAPCLHYIFPTLPSVWAVDILTQGVKKCKIIWLYKIMQCHIAIYLGAYNKVV